MLLHPGTRHNAEKERLDALLAHADAHIKVRANGEPVRTIFNGRRNRPVGLFPSVKSNCMVAWESRLERRAIRWLEVCDKVVRYREQPHTLHFNFEGRKTHYTPDFAVEHVEEGTWIVECKYQRDLRKMPAPERARLKEIRRLYRSVGLSFKFLTDLPFKQNPVWHENARQIEETRRLCPAPEQLASLVHHLEQNETSTLGACAQVIEDPSYGAARVLSLVMRRVVVAEDLDKPLGPATPIVLKAGYAGRVRDPRNLPTTMDGAQQ